MPRSAPSPLARVRRICLSLPETTERPSHGAVDDHHDDGRLALWCACPRGMREGLLKAEPEQYFVPPYVGFRGWIGVRLDRSPDWDAAERVIRDAYLTVAPKKLAATFLRI